MNVLNELLQWSRTRPSWQRDALRRLATRGVLEKSDIDDLIRLCKLPHGLVAGPDASPKAEPLEAKHLPDLGAEQGPVTLLLITHHSGVNALALEQTVRFGAKLTIVYGDNAAGKSGFTRILKGACRARGAEEILGNVLSGSIPPQPSATVRFAVGEDRREFQITGEANLIEALGHVSVFDSHCASVYLSERTDVAFRPFGLDLFDKISATCETVRKSLETERTELQGRLIPMPQLREGTAAFKWAASITSLTEPDEGKRLGQLSEVEKDRVVDIKKQLADLRRGEPRTTAQALLLRAGRVERLANVLQRAEALLDQPALALLFESRTKVQEAAQTVQQAQELMFSHSALGGTGSNLWRSLWEAAREFSVQHAYPNQHFPVVGTDARCVLCQQPIDDTAVQRLRQFEEHVRSVAQQELEKASNAYSVKSKLLRELEITNEESSITIEELTIEDDELALCAAEAVKNGEAQKQAALKALEEDGPLPATLTDVDFQVHRISQKVKELRDRSATLLREPGEDREERLLNELQELEARACLGNHSKTWMAEIDRKKRLNAYEVCLRDTDTRGITRKSSEVTEAAVTEQLTTSFKGELRKLGLGHLRVELKPAGGSRGALYHQLVLSDATSVRLTQVASEGEARVLALASFFAELSTASDASAILFDDPVSSLDHQWRDNVARRLAEEAKTRQVVIFTHDVVFLLALVDWAEKLGVECKHQHLRKEALGAGVSSAQLPWVAMRVRERIGVLKDMGQKAERVHRSATREEYEREAKYIYGRLRETWERAVEEVLLGGVVERFRSSIQTQKARILSDITEIDCVVLEEGMTKSSRWLTGHDQAAAANYPVPNPDELNGDIVALERWVAGIRARRM